ncbi:MAG: hypothetical protein Athens101428_222 [Candidatus Berkelbacteria bacterium Athens1014_28]|uniref:Uncharacterized protein n=1 Tax=Candidatus Berkelbacteria bacterium Athens1014_28 TaxID=2017145 RepID=A0A554LNZ3_9BACT|nr:MAG: hypothetical protein Athens101428_222 [Candidatus Berkelbacteria bacterium Athens1014_28]
MDNKKLKKTNSDEVDSNYFEDLEEKLLTESEKREQKEMLVSGKSVFEIERLKRKRKS